METIMFHRRRLARPLLITLLLLLIGCDKPTTDEGAEPAPPASPGVEGTGPEEPAPPADDRPAIKIAKLPVGDNSSGSSQYGEVEQCVGVAWLGDPIPDGVSVTVTGIGFSRRGAFSTNADLDCPGPPCRSFTFDSGRDTEEHFCSVAVRAEQDTASADLILNGRVRCRTGKRTCDVFIADVEGKDTSVSISGPDELPGPDEDPEPDPDGEGAPPSGDTPAPE
jgi:hypothetical protein